MRCKKGKKLWRRTGAMDAGRPVGGIRISSPGSMEYSHIWRHAGAMDAGRPVGGIRISREAGTTVRTASYLPTDCAVFCRFLSSRKVPPLLRLGPWHATPVVADDPVLSSCC